MKIINEALLNETTGRAKQSPRLRMNYNFHEHLDDPVNRLLNALEPGTYLRPHRHLNPKKDEIFLLLRGRIAVFLFDNKGEITQTQILDPKEGVYGAEIKAGTWHGLLVLESGSIIYEIKEGPFAPLAPENFAPWSPAPEDTKGVAKYPHETVITYLSAPLLLEYFCQTDHGFFHRTVILIRSDNSVLIIFNFQIPTSDNACSRTATGGAYLYKADNTVPWRETCLFDK